MCSIKRLLPGSYSSGHYVEIPHSSLHAHSGEPHAQRVVTETEVWRVDVEADESPSLLGGRDDIGVRDELGGESRVSTSVGVEARIRQKEC